MEEGREERRGVEGDSGLEREGQVGNPTNA